MGYIIWILIKAMGFVFRLFRRKNKNNKINCLLITYCGTNNTGAEARTIEAIKQIKDSTDKEILFHFITFNKENTLRYMSDIKNLEILTPNQLLFFFTLPVTLLKCDMAILVEGSGFRQNFSQMLLWYFLYSLGMAQELKLKTVSYGVDAGKLTAPNKFLTKKIANRIDLLMTRTNEAADFLKSINIKNKIFITADTAFGLTSKNERWISDLRTKLSIGTEKTLIGVAFKEFFWFPIDVDLVKAIKGDKKHHFSSIYYHTWNSAIEEKSNHFRQCFVDAIKQIKQEYNAEILFIAMESMDTDPCKEINELMGNNNPVISSNDYNANEIATILRSLNFLITTRYHALVLSMAAAVPTIAISHDERLNSIMNEMNLTNRFYYDYDAFPPEILKGKICTSFSDLYKDKDTVSKIIRNEYKTYCNKAVLNKTLLTEFLNTCNFNKNH